MNIKKLSVLVLLITLLALPSITNLTYANFDGNEEDVPKYFETTYPFSYLVDSNGTHAFMYNGTTGKLDFSSSSEMSVLQNAVGNTTDEGIVFIKAPFDTGTTGELQISNSITLMSDVKERNTYTYRRVFINKIVVNASANEIRGFRLKGVMTRYLLFNVENDYDIIGFSVEDSTFYSSDSSGSDGLVFRGDQSGSCVYDGSFTGCYHYNDRSDKELGAITFDELGYGTSQIYWTQCFFGQFKGNSTIFLVKENARIGLEIRLDDDNTYYAGDHDDMNFLKLEGTTDSLGYKTGLRFYIHDMDFDQHGNMTMFQIDSSTEQKFFSAQVEDCLISTSTGNMTLINNENAVWESAIHFVQFEGNLIRIPSEFQLGNCGYAYINYSILNNIGYNPLGEITNPVSSSYLVDSGSGSIANDTVYTVQGSPKTIYMQDGDTFDVKVNGDLVFNDVNWETVTLVSGETFELEWTSALDVLKVYGK